MVLLVYNSYVIQKLHPVQEQLIKLLESNTHEPLSLRDIRDLLHLSSHSTVQHHLEQLEKKGYLRRNPSNPQDFQVLATRPDMKVTYLNLYGMATCGPDGGVLDGNPIDRIAVESKILGFPSSDAFLVKAKGKSMEPKIHENDLVIVEKTKQVNNGDIVVCVNKEEVLIKKYTKEGDNVILVSLNEAFKPFVASVDLQIEGKVRGILSYL